MSGFPLLDPPHHLVEKIIAKVEPKSNFRLLRTCHTVKDLIQTSPNIIVHFDGDFRMKFNKSSNFELVHEKVMDNGWTRWTTIEFGACYGTRLRNITIYQRGKYDLLCELLKKYRITCEEVQLDEYYSAEQCAALIKLLKPISVRLRAKEDEDILEVVCNSKNLKRVDVTVEQGYVIPAIDRLLPNFEDVEVDVYQGTGDHFDVLREVLQAILSRPMTHVKKFKFTFAIAQDNPNTRIRPNIKPEFPNLQWTRLMDKYGVWEEISADFALPPHFPHGSSCRITEHITVDFKLVFYYITYEVKNASA